MRVRDVPAVIVEAGNEWLADKAPRLAAAVAFYTILSLAPLLVIATAIAGLVFGEEAARGEIVTQLRGLVGSAGAEVIQIALQNAGRPRAGAIATLLGILTLLFGASGVFAELQDALNTVWNVRSKPDRGWLGLVKDRFLSFAMVLGVGFLLLVSLIISAILAILGMYVERFFPELGTFVGVFNFALSFSVISALFAMMFRYLPDVSIPWRGVAIGAVITAALFTAGKFLIGLYLGQAGIETPFGAAGSVVAFVVWIYYSGLIFFFGAELTRVLTRHLGHHVEPLSHAEWIPGSEVSASA